MGPVEHRRREQCAQRQPHELHPPSEVAQRTLTERRERQRDHGPRQRRAHDEEHERRHGEAGEQPADAREPEQPHGQLVRGERSRAQPSDAPRDRAGVRGWSGPHHRAARAPVAGGQVPGCLGVGAEAHAHRDGRGHEDERRPRFQRRHGAAEARPVRHAVRGQHREGDPAGVVDAHAGRDPYHRDAHLPPRPRLAGLPAQQRERQGEQDGHQPAQHVELCVQVDDHVAGVAAPVEQLVDGRERLHGPLERADRERTAPGQDERCHRAGRPPHRAGDEPEQHPEAREHRDPGAHDQERVQRRGRLGLLGRQPTGHHQVALAEAEVQRRRVEGERAPEQEPEAAVDQLPGGAVPPSSGRR